MSSRRAITATIAGAAIFTMAVSGCTASGGGSDDGKITLSITTFGTMGVDANYDKYMEEHPNIVIEATNLEGGGAARDDAYAKIAAGTGLSDVVAIEEGWLSTIQEVSGSFVDLRDYGIEDVKSDWLDWKYEQGTDADGRVIGAGLDIGPQGICYRGDLFEAAGLPSERSEVAEYFGGEDASWDRFFEVGNEYVEASEKAFYHSPRFFWNSFVNQQAEGYYKADGETLNIEGNTALKNQLAKIVDAENAGLGAGLPGWDVGPQAKAGDFATYMCPSWMLGIVQGYYDEGTTDSGWDFADVLPGGAANWGGAFLGVSESSEHKEEAAALALWLAAPEQQAAAFEVAGPFPSTIEGQALVADSTNAFFNDAPVGEIFSARSEGVIAQVKGPEDSNIQDNVFGPVFDRIGQGEITDGDAAWDEAMVLLNQLVG
ncbi:extracellular solute-binding protein [Salinibacterium sp. NK8237]|uniref:ABC transporter substrate-binding protein n=1 Tax=Salinibacterium sp. NK8237 TaxID=2792038 RepID=UPI0027DDE468|nr:extracellular solute-binding protein [Salinibacterium sp. NK8237]